MRYFLPELTFQRGSLPVDKLGGLPWGMPSDLWPLCKACAKPQSLLAQFSHHDQRLDLGKPGRILYEIEGVDLATARDAMRLAAQKLPIRTKFVTRADQEGGAI